MEVGQQHVLEAEAGDIVADLVDVDDLGEVVAVFGAPPVGEDLPGVPVDEEAHSLAEDLQGPAVAFRRVRAARAQFAGADKAGQDGQGEAGCRDAADGVFHGC